MTFVTQADANGNCPTCGRSMKLTDAEKDALAQSYRGTDFDDWQKHQSEDLLDRMPIVQQASHYASDTEWHNRKSDVDYDFRNN